MRINKYFLKYAIPNQDSTIRYSFCSLKVQNTDKAYDIFYTLLYFIMDELKNKNIEVSYEEIDLDMKMIDSYTIDPNQNEEENGQEEG
jgi:hypothetical protein